MACGDDDGEHASAANLKREYEGRPAGCGNSSVWENLSDNLVETVLSLLPTVLSLLPTPCLVHAGSVCKRWNSIVRSAHFKKLCSLRPPQRSWLFAMVKNRFLALKTCVAYSAANNKWYKLPCTGMPLDGVLVAGARGLLCFRTRDHMLRSLSFHVVNPITQHVKLLPPVEFDNLASFNKAVHPWNSSVALQVVETAVGVAYKVLLFITDEDRPGVEIHIYDSTIGSWRVSETSRRVTALGMRQSALIGGFCYFLVQVFTIAAYDIEHDVWTEVRTPKLDVLTNCKLVDCEGELMAVGFRGRGEFSRENFVEIWQMETSSREWEKLDINASAEVGVRILHRWRGALHQCAGGCKGEIYFIKADAGHPRPLMYDHSTRSWKSLPRCPELEDARLLQIVSFVPRWGLLYSRACSSPGGVTGNMGERRVDKNRIYHSFIQVQK